MERCISIWKNERYTNTSLLGVVRVHHMAYLVFDFLSDTFICVFRDDIYDRSASKLSVIILIRLSIYRMASERHQKEEFKHFLSDYGFSKSFVSRIANDNLTQVTALPLK